MTYDPSQGDSGNVNQGLDIANQIFGADVVADFIDSDENGLKIASQLADYAEKTGSNADQIEILIGDLTAQGIDWVAALDNFSNQSNQNAESVDSLATTETPVTTESGIEAFLAKEDAAVALKNTAGIDPISGAYPEGGNPGGHDSGGSMPFGASGTIAGYTYKPAFGPTYTGDSESTETSNLPINVFVDPDNQENGNTNLPILPNNTDSEHADTANDFKDTKKGPEFKVIEVTDKSVEVSGKDGVAVKFTPATQGGVIDTNLKEGLIFDVKVNDETGTVTIGGMSNGKVILMNVDANGVAEVTIKNPDGSVTNSTYTVDRKLPPNAIFSTVGEDLNLGDLIAFDKLDDKP